MIFDNMLMPDNALPLDNIVPPQNMWAAQNGRMMPSNTMLAQQNAATAQNNATTQTTTSQNRAAMQNAIAQNMMPARNRVNVATMQSNISDSSRTQAKMQLAQSCFAVHEAVLFLDTHPNDQNAVEYFRRKQQQLTQASDNYQKIIGPIRSCTVDTSSGSWRWVETPWPWELEED